MVPDGGVKQARTLIFATMVSFFLMKSLLISSINLKNVNFEVDFLNKHSYDSSWVVVQTLEQ